MKKIILTLGVLFLAPLLWADTSEDFNYIPYSSYTDVATPGAVLFTSAAVQVVAITISSPTGLNTPSYVAFYRSTSPVLLISNVSTQTKINTSFLNTGPITVNLFDMKNTSYTFMSKVGSAEVTIWLRYPLKNNRSGNYPGLPESGLKTKGKIEFK